MDNNLSLKYIQIDSNNIFFQTNSNQICHYQINENILEKRSEIAFEEFSEFNLLYSNESFFILSHPKRKISIFKDQSLSPLLTDRSETNNSNFGLKPVNKIRDKSNPNTSNRVSKISNMLKNIFDKKINEIENKFNTNYVDNKKHNETIEARYNQEKNLRTIQTEKTPERILLPFEPNKELRKNKTIQYNFKDANDKNMRKYNNTLNITKEEISIIPHKKKNLFVIQNSENINIKSKQTEIKKRKNSLKEEAINYTETVNTTTENKYLTDNNNSNLDTNYQNNDSLEIETESKFPLNLIKPNQNKQKFLNVHTKEKKRASDLSSICSTEEFKHRINKFNHNTNNLSKNNNNIDPIYKKKIVKSKSPIFSKNKQSNKKEEKNIKTIKIISNFDEEEDKYKEAPSNQVQKSRNEINPIERVLLNNNPNFKNHSNLFFDSFKKLIDKQKDNNNNVLDPFSSVNFIKNREKKS